METLEKKSKNKTISSETLNIVKPVKVRNGKTTLDHVLSNMNWKDEFVIGAGVDAITGETTSCAVKMSKPITPEVKNSSYLYTLIEDESQMRTEFEASLSGEYNMQTLDVKGSAKYLKHVQTNEVTKTLVAKYQFEYDGYEGFEDYELTPEAQKVFDQHPEEFRNIYGDYFIAGGKRMGSFIGTFTCTAADKESIDQFALSLSGGSTEVFTADGNTSFMQKAKEHHVRVSTAVEIAGLGDDSLQLPNDGEDILKQLEWFKEHAKGSYLRAKLKHYCTINPNIDREINVHPDVFIQLSVLYFNLWDVRFLFDSCPSKYRAPFEEEKRELETIMMVKQQMMVKDNDLRTQMQDRIVVLKTALKTRLNRMKFYYEYLLDPAKTKEAEKGVLYEQETDRAVWPWGITESPIEGIILRTISEPHYEDGGIPVFRMYKDANVPIIDPVTKKETGKIEQIITGWKLESKKSGLFHNFWKKDCTQIIGEHEAQIFVQGGIFSVQDWVLTLYSVDKKDYEFGAGEAE